MIELLKKHPKILFFGFVTMFFTSYGQTFLVAQFLPDLREAFQLGQKELATGYGLATFFSSLLLGHFGKMIDHRPLYLFGIVTTLVLAVALSLLGYAQNIWLIYVAFFILRASGQVTLGLISSTLLGKIFGKHRGKALMMASFGRSLGEGLLPVIVVQFCFPMIGWRYTFFALALSLLLGMLPLFVFWVKDFNLKPLFAETENVQKKQKVGREWNFKELIAEKNALILMLCGSILPFVVTGLFFQQESILELRGWQQNQMSQAFILYSIVNVAGTLAWGPLIDKFEARRLLPWSLLPISLGIAFLVWGPLIGKSGAFVYLTLMALSIGVTGIVRHAYWAEAYGVETLGQLKGLDSTFMVIGTSLAPSLFGWLLDEGISTAGILTGFFTLCLLGTVGFFYVTIQNQKSGAVELNL